MQATEKVFSRSSKLRWGCLSMVLPLAGLLIPDIAVLIAVLTVVPENARGGALAILLPVGFIVGLLLWAGAFFFQPRPYNRLWRDQLAEKIRQREGLKVDDWSVQFVGWSPGNKLGQWEGDTDRDLGFLIFGPEWLTYLGDDFRFSLRREWVWQIDQSISSGPPLLARRVVVGHVWPDGYQHFCNFESRGDHTAWGLKAANEKLAELLRAWHQGTAFQSAPAPPFVEFGPPEQV